MTAAMRPKNPSKRPASVPCSTVHRPSFSTTPSSVGTATARLPCAVHSSSCSFCRSCTVCGGSPSCRIDEPLRAAELGQAREQRPHGADAGMLDARPIAHQGPLIGPGSTSSCGSIRGRAPSDQSPCRSIRQPSPSRCSANASSLYAISEGMHTDPASAPCIEVCFEILILLAASVCVVPPCASSRCPRSSATSRSACCSARTRWR